MGIVIRSAHLSCRSPLREQRGIYQGQQEQGSIAFSNTGKQHDAFIRSWGAAWRNSKRRFRVIVNRIVTVLCHLRLEWEGQVQRQEQNQRPSRWRYSTCRILGNETVVTNTAEPSRAQRSCRPERLLSYDEAAARNIQIGD